MSHVDHSILGRPRASGILLHPTSLPSPYGIGTMGPEAEQFLDFLVSAGQSLWQMLPTGPTGYGDSPYQGFSAFAGNPLLIGIEELLTSGLLQPDDVAGLALDHPHPPAQVDFRAVIPWKTDILRRAFARFTEVAMPSDRDSLVGFRNEHHAWLEDFALFMALKEAHQGVAWLDWAPGFRDRDPGALQRFAADQSREIDYHAFVQWIFHSQWNELRRGAAERGISIIGDIPIFVSLDSSDVWASRRLFQLDESGNPTVVAGVPPDYYTDTGQLWGNPIYDWKVHESTGFEWWRRVLQGRFTMFDYVRIDHFRGFCAYWAVPSGDATAANGEWLPVPGKELFRSLEEQLGAMSILAEDLGVITPDVVALMDQFGFPGMKILQFGFDEREADDHLPYAYGRNAVVYTGGHDNDTVLGWLSSATEKDRAKALRYLASDGAAPHWDFIRCALSSTAHFAVTPMQDVIGLGSEARMNRPGTLGGNWLWRMTGSEPLADLAIRLRELTELYGRAPR